MIDENTYFIGMTVISYLVSTFLVFGMMYIQVCKSIVKDDKVDDIVRNSAKIMLEEFYESSYITKIVIILKLGALFTSVITTDLLKLIFNGGKDK